MPNQLSRSSTTFRRVASFQRIVAVSVPSLSGLIHKISKCASSRQKESFGLAQPTSLSRGSSRTGKGVGGLRRLHGVSGGL